MNGYKRIRNGSRLFFILLSIILLDICPAIACEYVVCSTTGYGREKSNNISGLLEIHAYSFTAEKGDILLVRAVRLSGNLAPRIEVFDPDGNQIAAAGNGGKLASIEDRMTESDGSYLILVRDLNGNGVGGYSLGLQCVNHPGDFQLLSYEDWLGDNLVNAAEMNVYQFNAAPGDIVILQMIGLDDVLTPFLELFDPAWNRIAEATDNSMAVIVNQELIAGGTYTFIASDYYGDEVGEYLVVLQRLALDADDELSDNIPSHVTLRQNSPNPFNPSTRIDFYLPRASEAGIVVYDIRGNKVRTFDPQYLPAGAHSIVWNGENQSGAGVASGIYIYRLIADGLSKTRKMILLK